VLGGRRIDGLDDDNEEEEEEEEVCGVCGGGVCGLWGGAAMASGRTVALVRGGWRVTGVMFERLRDLKVLKE
jgi:hypothetical protein